MPIAILDPFSGISGDMTLGALVDVGLDPEWLRALPARLGLAGVGVRVQDVLRGELACKKVDFDIPPQPHGRHIREIRAIVAAAGLPDEVRRRADAAFTAVAEVEGQMHGVPAESVHLHEVGAVDAILDVVGSIWGFAVLGLDRVFCGPLPLGDGSVIAAHGRLPVPAPATLKLLEGHQVRSGPENSGELVTPTGAALVRVLSSGPPPEQFVPRRSGYGAGSRDPSGRANALRLIVADDPVATAGPDAEDVVLLAADVDDLAPEYVAAAADALRALGALDVVTLPLTMKKGRVGVRLEVLARPEDATQLEAALFAQTTTLGVRRTLARRRALAREHRTVTVLGHQIGVKVAVGPGGERHAKPEFEDVRSVADATGKAARDVFFLAVRAAEQL
jgi:pyridinium-3,5-bisthiocarboxylic acid mononucleotide nickel chelatase